MTAIAYRDGILASDTLCGIEPLKLNEPKIMKKDGYLIGMSGDNIPSINDFAKWFFADLKSSRRHEFKGADFEVMVVTPSGQVQIWQNTGLYYPIKQKFWACGSGAGVCMGAMEHGATAVQAVKAAIKWAQSCGGRVISKRLK